jgi:hypothetical protein
VLAGALAIAIGATWATHKTIVGRDAGVTLVVMLLALKTLELRARRDAMVVFFLGFFVLLSNFFYSQSLPTAMAMVLGLMGLLTALVNAHMTAGKPPLTQALRTAGWLALWGAPSWWRCFCSFRAWRRCGACHPTIWPAARACPRTCAWAKSPRWHWTIAWPCASASILPGPGAARQHPVLSRPRAQPVRWPQLAGRPCA